VKGKLPSTPERRALMGRVRQMDTAAELAVGSALRRLGRRYRKNVRSLPGSPDFANKSAKWAIFVHGCFWHRHSDCRRTTTPRSNTKFWQDKFDRNVERDARNQVALCDAGFRVLIVWECQTQQAETALRDFFESRRI
jgi:DNA mismatch endonuclease (patch repair protein)